MGWLIIDFIYTNVYIMYCQISDIRRTLVGIKIVGQRQLQDETRNI